MKKLLLIWTVLFFSFLKNESAGQNLSMLDSCFSSCIPGPTFTGSATLTNAADADLLEWNGSVWNGAWSNANITVPPPCSAPPVRAVWIGDQTVWTSAGESFGLKFSPPLVAGNTYVFFFTSVSDGFGSNGLFSPDVYTNNTGTTGGNAVGNLDTVGFTWETHPFVFTATAAQNGDDYIVIHSNDGSGMVLNFCAETTTNLGDDSLTICFGDSAILFAGNGFQSYSWSTGETTAQLTVHNSGTYISTNIGFCGTSTDTIVVTVDPCGQFPVAVFSTPDNHICPGTCTDFTNLSQSATSYIWNFTGASPASSTDTDPTSICYNSPGSYSVQLIASNGITSDTLTLNNFITVYPFPAAQGILQNGDTLFANAGAVAYQWYHDGIIIPGATEYNFVAPESGSYSVIVTDNNGCEVEAVIFDVIASLSQLANHNSQFTIYPIPADGIIYLQWNKFSQIDFLVIYNVLGEKVLVEQNLQTENLSDGINIFAFPSGAYFVELQSDGKYQRMKFIKQ